MESKLAIVVVGALLLTLITRYASIHSGIKYIKYLYHIMLTGISLSVLVVFVMVSLITSEVKSTAPSMENVDYAVVLGAGLIGDQVSNRLKLRLDAAVEVLLDTDTMIIVSGGQGPDEKISEAEAMYRYLVKEGINKDRIVLEDQSTSTQENIRLSNELINIDNANVMIITSDYHMYRSKMLGNRIGWEVSGQSAVNPIKTRYRRMFREIFALLKDIVVRK